MKNIIDFKAKSSEDDFFKDRWTKHNCGVINIHEMKERWTESIAYNLHEFLYSFFVFYTRKNVFFFNRSFGVFFLFALFSDMWGLVRLFLFAFFLSSYFTLLLYSFWSANDYPISWKRKKKYLKIFQYPANCETQFTGSYCAWFWLRYEKNQLFYVLLFMIISLFKLTKYPISIL